MISPNFKAKLQKIRNEIAETDFVILIWGPGRAADNPKARKRQALRESLSKTFGENNVIFSEDDSLSEYRKKWGDIAAEYIEAKAADVIIIIAESPGSIAEAAFYGTENASKIIVFAENRPEEREGFAGKVYSRLKVESVEPEEWSTCQTVLRKAHDFAEILRVEKYRLLSASYL